MLRNTAEIRVGRLLEIRVDAGFRTAADADRVFEMIERALAELPRAQNIVTVADWRGCSLMDGQAAGRIIQGMAANNARVERSAALASRHSHVAVLQFMRMIRESRNPNRKMFFDAKELSTWLNEALTEAELRRLQQFLER